MKLIFVILCLFSLQSVAGVVWDGAEHQGERPNILGPVVDTRVDEVLCIIWYCHDKQSDGADAAYMWLD